MKRHIDRIEYHHGDTVSSVVMEFRVDGKSSTHLRAESSQAVGGSPWCVIESTFSDDGIGELAHNEGITRTEAAGVMTDVLADIEKAARLDREARRGLTDYVLTELAEGGGS